MKQFRFTVTSVALQTTHTFTINGALGVTITEMTAKVQSIYPGHQVKCTHFERLPMEKTFIPGSALREYDVTVWCPVNDRFDVTAFNTSAADVLAKFQGIYPHAVFAVNAVPQG